MKYAQLVCCPGIHDYPEGDGTNRDITEGPDLREKKNLVKIIVRVKRADKRKWMK